MTSSFDTTSIGTNVYNIERAEWKLWCLDSNNKEKVES